MRGMCLLMEALCFKQEQYEIRRNLKLVFRSTGSTTLVVGDKANFMISRRLNFTSFPHLPPADMTHARIDAFNVRIVARIFQSARHAPQYWQGHGQKRRRLPKLNVKSWGRRLK